MSSVRSAKLSSEVRSAWNSFSASSWVTAIVRMVRATSSVVAPSSPSVVRELTLVVPTPRTGTLGDTQSLVIPDDQMALSIELTDFERVAGFVNPGNEVAVFATTLNAVKLLPDNKEQKLGTYTRIVLTRNLVLGVGTTSVTSRTTQDDEGGTATEEVAKTILTIAVTQEEAEKLIQADRTGELNFALLTDDSKSADNEGAFLSDVYPELFRGVAP